jgi:hypothetical protein
MLKKQIELYLAKITNNSKSNGVIEIHSDERNYAERIGLLDGSELSISELAPGDRFEDAYIERGNKETEEFLATESSHFLNQSISYFRKHKNEFMYMESDWWDVVGVDAVSFENDDVFGTYDVMLGLKLQKKYGPAIKSFLNENLQGEGNRFDLMFDANEGIWSLNFALNCLQGYNDDLTIGEAFGMIYSFLFKLAERVVTN